jgi:hypothetical protein
MDIDNSSPLQFPGIQTASALRLVVQHVQHVKHVSKFHCYHHQRPPWRQHYRDIQHFHLHELDLSVLRRVQGPLRGVTDQAMCPNT